MNKSFKTVRLNDKCSKCFGRGLTELTKDGGVNVCRYLGRQE